MNLGKLLPGYQTYRFSPVSRVALRKKPLGARKIALPVLIVGRPKGGPLFYLEYIDNIIFIIYYYTQFLAGYY